MVGITPSSNPTMPGDSIVQFTVTNRPTTADEQFNVEVVAPERPPPSRVATCAVVTADETSKFAALRAASAAADVSRVRVYAQSPTDTSARNSISSNPRPNANSATAEPRSVSSAAGWATAR